MSDVTRRVDGAGEDAPLPERPRRGMVCTSHPRAVDAALAVLRDGGNAVDAAVCAAAVLGVVEPMSTGIGGDCFALAWKPGDEVPAGLNGSGRAPAAASAEAIVEAGHPAVPQEGLLPVTVPGALHAWQTLLDARGTMPLGDLLRPAIESAENGFEVLPTVAHAWAVQAPRLRGGAGGKAWLVGEQAPEVGSTFRQPELAETLRRIADEGIDAFYRGVVADRIDAFAAEHRGWITRADLEAHQSEWVEPIEISYRGHPVFELPPNGQGLVALEALALLEGYPLGDVDEVERHHLMIEAVKLAFADGLAHIGDPDHLRVSPEALLDEDYLERQRERIGEQAMDAPSPGTIASDTVHVSVVDRDGGCCSLINSLYFPFGSATCVEGTGILLQNRGALFRLDPDHPSYLAPGRRPYHTIIPAMVFRSDRPWLVFGVVGGFQQPQGHVQLLSRMIDRAEDPDVAVRAPRFRWEHGAAIRVEEGIPDEVVEGLRSRGHELVEDETYGGFGRAQVIRIDPDSGELAGGSDPRADGRVGTLDD